MTKAEKRSTWVLWMTAVVLLGMIFCRLTMVYGMPIGEMVDWPFLKGSESSEMGAVGK